jgi:hypothetical protein
LLCFGHSLLYSGVTGRNHHTCHFLHTCTSV